MTERMDRQALMEEEDNSSCWDTLRPSCQRSCYIRIAESQELPAAGMKPDKEERA